MAKGGTFLNYNKVLPGAYINFISKDRVKGIIGDRGTCAIALKHDFGANNEIITIDNETLQKDSLKILGYKYQDEKLRPFREILKRAKMIKFFRLSSGEKAKATIGNLTVTAKYTGSRSNNIKIVIENDVDTSKSIVKTFIDTNIEVDYQIVENIEELQTNDFVTFSGSGEFTETAGTNLTGGTNKEITGSEYSEFLDKIESEHFNVIVYDGDDNTTKSLFESFTKRLRYDEGIKISCVLVNYNKANDESIISIDDVAKELIYWSSGALAGAELNESLTNTLYDGELFLKINLKNRELEEKIKKGIFAFYSEKEEIRVLKDINTFTSFSAEKSSDFSNNQIIRILDNIGNDIATIFNMYYLGKEQNDEIGRDIFKSELISYFKNLQSTQALTNFSAEDVSVEKGEQKGDVIVNTIIEPISSMDKLYMKCLIN